MFGKSSTASFGQAPKATVTSPPAAIVDSSSSAAQTTRTSRKHGLDEDTRQQYENEALSVLAKLGYTGLTPDDLAKLLPPDIYEEELEVMAEVRAYFQVAYKVRSRFMRLLCSAHCLSHSALSITCQ